ncbi:FAD-dependent 5-carboxymethylaminomethyl-2-thiouridine(34) oxidoreductase MnmC [Bordetella sp. 15P40C-2]|uniref:FAD-dependent 5-carboxymethylaminomethyl-2-thiouridine(34) oxidoreductase MnmC n=1 Tax=Bordetella sp. 15P40C-2 TaxID=2572246 RepID=UPI0013235224|nr:FAD-dependent 5-carboxymethylaminomethyl-2-thiouridine(34) oxidoreductase MnmC [Bordetella sp. 15P40C-2]MVW71757.1 FAD-dependent 5-carboxymethylaminomethyl-2-thiouridine(34) oxidoreductase MnmC [Bordetella sp. 15P40C-2]
MSYVPLIPPDVGFDAEGHFRNTFYGDVYHSTAGALGQAEYVFLRGNGLPQRWRGRASFTVCETGFGLGMNFLALWRAWRDDPARSRRLHMLSVEAHPFARDDVTQILRRIAPDALRGLAEQLVAQWPACLPGLHRLEFEGGAVTLTLAFGDAATVVPRLRARVDAYFLDGFAPRRNPDLWRPELMRDLARLAAPDATLATWASAGAVRRALVDAGFDVGRQPGYAGKLHMTVGVRSKPDTGASGEFSPTVASGKAAGFDDRIWDAARDADTDKSGEVVIIGAGLAGAGLAQALALRGRPVVVIDPASTPQAMSHAGHVAAALTPVIARDDNSRARLSRAGSARAWARWAGLSGEAAPLRCGTLQLDRDEGRSAALGETLSQLRFPGDWAHPVDREQASSLAGISVARGGVFFREGMLVQPARLIPALLQAEGVRRVVGVASVLQRAETGWEVCDADGVVLARGTTVILANAFGAQALLRSSGLLDPLPRLAQMHRLAGQVSLLTASDLAGGPRCIIGGEGYLLPAVDGVCVAGSTYEHGASVSQMTAEGQHTVLGKVRGLLGYDWPTSCAPGQLPGWAGWRAVLPGRLPAIGPLAHAPGVWLAAGYASRGLSWSALAGDIIASALCDEPLPLEADLLTALAPR